MRLPRHVGNAIAADAQLRQGKRGTRDHAKAVWLNSEQVCVEHPVVDSAQH
jgi:hypothetical protein